MGSSSFSCVAVSQWNALPTEFILCPYPDTLSCLSKCWSLSERASELALIAESRVRVCMCHICVSYFKDFNIVIPSSVLLCPEVTGRKE